MKSVLLFLTLCIFVAIVKIDLVKGQPLSCPLSTEVAPCTGDGCPWPYYPGLGYVFGGDQECLTNDQLGEGYLCQINIGCTSVGITFRDNNYSAVAYDNITLQVIDVYGENHFFADSPYYQEYYGDSFVNQYYNMYYSTWINIGTEGPQVCETFTLYTNVTGQDFQAGLICDESNTELPGCPFRCAMNSQAVLSDGPVDFSYPPGYASSTSSNFYDDGMQAKKELKIKKQLDRQAKRRSIALQ